MTYWQQAAILIYGSINLGVLLKAFYEIKYKKNTYGLASLFGLIGIFVWGDAVVLAPFWLVTSLITLYLKDWYMFLLIISIFWVVRSAGEVIYWISEQFSDKHRNPPQTLKFYKFFNSDAIWFVYQLFWQCTLIISLIASIYFTFLWLQTKF